MQQTTIEVDVFLQKIKKLSNIEKAHFKKCFGKSIEAATPKAWSIFAQCYQGNKNSEKTYFIIATTKCFMSNQLNYFQKLSFVQCLKNLEQSELIEKYFMKLLGAEIEEEYFLHTFTKLIRNIKQNNLNIDFNQLLVDLLNWGNNERIIQRKWMQEYVGIIED